MSSAKFTYESARSEEREIAHAALALQVRRIDQTCLGLSGAVGPTWQPLFHGVTGRVYGRGMLDLAWVMSRLLGRGNAAEDSRLGKPCQCGRGLAVWAHADPQRKPDRTPGPLRRSRDRDGRYQNASEVMREGLRLLERRDAEDAAKLARLRSAVDEARAAVRAGEHDEVADDRLPDWLASLEATGRRRGGPSPRPRSATSRTCSTGAANTSAPTLAVATRG